MFDRVIEFIKSLYPGMDIIPLHEPRFIGNEKKYLNDVIDSTFVSSAGAYISRFERMICEITGAKHAIATVNGTAGLQVALKVAGVEPGDEVITQPLTFVATANAISYCGAQPLFIDVDKDSAGLSPKALEAFLKNQCRKTEYSCLNDRTGRRISACVPMHTFGHPCRVDEIAKLCDQYHIKLVEDSAESLGSLYKEKHSGTFGAAGVYSFNGNKTVTCGGGGIIVTDNPQLAERAKHITTTAKIAHAYEYVHDEIGYNFRLPNLNAALACAQLENLALFVEKKRKLSQDYQDFFRSEGIHFLKEPENAQSNCWLNAILLPNRKVRDVFLEKTNNAGILTRPAWKLLNELNIYRDCISDSTINAKWLEDRIVNLPSSVTE